MLGARETAGCDRSQVSQRGFPVGMAIRVSGKWQVELNPAAGWLAVKRRMSWTTRGRREHLDTAEPGAATVDRRASVVTYLNVALARQAVRRRTGS